MAKESIFRENRNSRMLLGEVYFWTDTAKDWIHAFESEHNKMIVLQSLKTLVERKKIALYAFVIMPNHVHFVWKMSALNGKEMPHSSFNKYTAHLILDQMKHNPLELLKFKVSEKERNFRLWQQDPLAVLMDSEEKIEQKIEYIHNNPLQERWNLAEYPEDYKWSSAKFYETGNDDFDFLTDYREVF